MQSSFQPQIQCTCFKYKSHVPNKTENCCKKKILFEIEWTQIVPGDLYAF